MSQNVKIEDADAKESKKVITPKSRRYFDMPIEENRPTKININTKAPPKFAGDVIRVEQKKEKRLANHFKFKKNKFNPNNARWPKPKIPKEKLEKYSHGEKATLDGVKTKFFKEKQQRKEQKLDYAAEFAARTELLLQEQEGFIQPDEEEITASYRQSEIAKNVDIFAASKGFKLNLDFGPYAMHYTKNGRHLLLGGRRGHVAGFDWVTKKLHCEINVMEEVVDVSWLHIHTMFACAQKNWVYIYDNQGTELHCVKRLYRVNRLEFLPYHFLLATGNCDGYVSWLDVSIGELVGNYNSRLGDIRLMKQNPGNGVLCIGGGKGVVSMWSPKVREPLATMLCHSTPMSALTVDPKGKHLITAGLDRKVKIWDIRELSGPLATYQLKLPANNLVVSQRDMLALSQGSYCEIYSNALMDKKQKSPYLRHHCGGYVQGMQFCPYEDILGVSTDKGFQSLLVPGCGEPNFDAFEDNPFQTKSQRREHEVHALLEKIPPELITLDPKQIASVDVPSLEEKLEAKRALFFVKPPQIQIKTRNKMKGRGGSAKAARSKQIVKDSKRKEFLTQLQKSKQEVIKEFQESEDFIPLETPSKPSVLDRFRPKRKRT